MKGVVTIGPPPRGDAKKDPLRDAVKARQRQLDHLGVDAKKQLDHLGVDAVPGRKLARRASLPPSLPTRTSSASASSEATEDGVQGPPIERPVIEKLSLGNLNERLSAVTERLTSPRGNAAAPTGTTPRRHLACLGADLCTAEQLATARGSCEPSGSQTALCTPQCTPQSPRRHLSCFMHLFCLGKLDEETPRVDSIPVAKAVSGSIFPEAKPEPKPGAKAKGKAKAKAPPPRPKASMQRRASCPAPAWKGPQPSSEWKSDRVVNWVPIRQTQLLEGSVWKQVNESIEQRDQLPLDMANFNSAFMHLVDDPKLKKTPRRWRRKQNLQRLLSASDALLADCLHYQLSKKGMLDSERLSLVVGTRPKPTQNHTKDAGIVDILDLEEDSDTSSSSTSSSTSSDSEDSSSHRASLRRSGSEDTTSRRPSEDTTSRRPSLKRSGSQNTDFDSSGDEVAAEKDESAWEEESLQTLLRFLQLAVGIEDKLKAGFDDEQKYAAPEHLLQQLLLNIGPAALLLSRVQNALSITSFPREADELERSMRIGIHAARSAVSSTALRLLLEGVLLLGNYVNSSSQVLGSAHGVTLESIAKLAHTRCLETQPDAEGSNPRQRPQKTKDALTLLVRQLQDTQGPSWLYALLSDLEDCRRGCDLDCSTISSGVKDLAAKVKDIEAHLSSPGSFETGEPSVLTKERLERFVAYASPRVAMLRSLDEDLNAATVSMRKYFAEPPRSPLAHMLRSLGSLLDVLPKPDRL